MILCFGQMLLKSSNQGVKWAEYGTCTREREEEEEEEEEEEVVVEEEEEENAYGI